MGTGSAIVGDSANGTLANGIAGAVVLKTPSIFSPTSYYKLGATVTFEWNYTNVVQTPAALHVVAYCQDAARDYTIAGNISGAATRVEWDTGEQMATVNFPV